LELHLFDSGGQPVHGGHDQLNQQESQMKSALPLWYSVPYSPDLKLSRRLPSSQHYGVSAALQLP
jgi:hypothetical protein